MGIKVFVLLSILSITAISVLIIYQNDSSKAGDLEPFAEKQITVANEEVHTDEQVKASENTVNNLADKSEKVETKKKGTDEKLTYSKSEEKKSASENSASTTSTNHSEDDELSLKSAKNSTQEKSTANSPVPSAPVTQKLKLVQTNTSKTPTNISNEPTKAIQSGQPLAPKIVKPQSDAKESKRNAEEVSVTSTSTNSVTPAAAVQSNTSNAPIGTSAKSTAETIASQSSQPVNLETIKPQIDTKELNQSSVSAEIPVTSSKSVQTGEAKEVDDPKKSTDHSNNTTTAESSKTQTTVKTRENELNSIEPVTTIAANDAKSTTTTSTTESPHNVLNGKELKPVDTKTLSNQNDFKAEEHNTSASLNNGNDLSLEPAKANTIFPSIQSNDNGVNINTSAIKSTSQNPSSPTPEQLAEYNAKYEKLSKSISGEESVLKAVNLNGSDYLSNRPPWKI